MKNLLTILVLSAVTLLSGCTINLPFNNRLDYKNVTLMKSIDVGTPTVNIVWEPNTFVSRIDIQGASGFVGGGSRTRIPTGVAISSRVEEAIAQYATLNANGTPLIIEVLDAKSKFEYSAGIFNITPGMDVGGATLKVRITYKEQVWENTYTSYLKDPTIGANSLTYILEKAWDDVSIQLAKDVANHIK